MQAPLSRETFIKFARLVAVVAVIVSASACVCLFWPAIFTSRSAVDDDRWYSASPRPRSARDTAEDGKLNNGKSVMPKGRRNQGDSSKLERYRPLYHFTPEKMWMNDPNGMFYRKGVYHLYYQYHPYGLTWGPMHWGHASTKDLMHWRHHSVALAPDDLGYIFSGSAVVDEANTSGCGKGCVVAFFTHHDPWDGKEVQSVAYSVDGGFTFEKYAGNPVLESPGPQDFRDPKVFWDTVGNQWVMTVAAYDCVMFYGSQDTRTWRFLSDFGKDHGSHEGVWECPELFPIMGNDRVQHHVLLVSVSDGAPNLGTGTQYFLGFWDGRRFHNTSKHVHWLDYGRDNYASVSWNGGSDGTYQRIIGWMTNWRYANSVPATTWRSMMTLPRDLRICDGHVEKQLCSTLPSLVTHAFGKAVKKVEGFPLVGLLDLIVHGNARLFLSSAAGDVMKVFLSRDSSRISLDRRGCGGPEEVESDLWGERDDESGVHHAPWISAAVDHVKIALDRTSIEIFADAGRVVMTETFFPEADLDKLVVHGAATYEYFPYQV